ncbi:molybdenum cofactor biosynthesis protein A [Rubripirellula amarantea]|uniref:Molybdenum cofactor biosynthesis protein A n=1 Tax=Rubripirellula amarantea TaxID=2527999 RepID=A0A5C5WS88_9BACT|nr:arsenosugar biosynthesis radical SAM (seleno)protein ArsS [Rubripirellula amarantea]TWT53031.1 molybdenum cofactor biosynthesis protein A [Rubripirellula amarantea]
MSVLLPVIDAGLPTGIVAPFGQRIRQLDGDFTRTSLANLQINLGKLCNQTCTHCHVEAGPTKTRENMNSEVADRVMELASLTKRLQTVDLTGGAPEMNPHFRRLVRFFRSRDLQVIDRCNLTILTQPGYEDLADFLAEQGVNVVASLPCYLEDNVDGQRGNGVFARSIEGIRMLNERGYGKTLPLDLVYNPTGPSLPPDQTALQADYKRELKARYDIEFNSLFCITNIPIKRYAQYLAKRNKLDDYMRLLADSFNPAAVSSVMCRSLVSIGWDGAIYDCDFNQMLEIPLAGEPRQSVWDINTFDDVIHKSIATADHCYGCTAGSGSSCGGAIVNE